MSLIRSKYGHLRNKSPYLVEMRENTDQEISEYGHFLRIATASLFYIIDFLDVFAFQNIHPSVLLLLAFLGNVK